MWVVSWKNALYSDIRYRWSNPTPTNIQTESEIKVLRRNKIKSYLCLRKANMKDGFYGKTGVQDSSYCYSTAVFQINMETSSYLLITRFFSEPLWISLSESLHTSSPSPRDENILRKRVWLKGLHATEKAIIFPDEKQITDFGNLIMFVKTISIDE